MVSIMKYRVPENETLKNVFGLFFLKRKEGRKEEVGI